MIYITGDTHANFHRLNTTIFPEQKEMTKDDYVIICGDFGGIWAQEGSDYQKEENSWLNWLEGKPFTTLFVDGNHENFDRLYAFPVERWHGGNVHRIRSSVIHLMRGQIYEINGKKIFTFGGASSHDIQGGILEPDDPDFYYKWKRLDAGTLPYRINHLSWWKEELPSDDEMAMGWANLEANDYQVDFIVTHCCSSNTQAYFSAGMYKADRLTDYLEKVRQKTEFVKWFFGHYHDNRNVYAKEIMLYEQIIRIA